MSWIDHAERTLSAVFKIVRAPYRLPLIGRCVSLIRRAYWRSYLQQMGRGCQIYPNVVIHCPGKVSLGNDVSIAEFAHIWGGGEVTIGNSVMIASHTAITSQTHLVDPATRRTNVFAPVVIGDNVWIGSGAIILPGVTVGENSVIAAGSVVTRDVPCNTLVKGTPARVSKVLDGSGQG